MVERTLGNFGVFGPDSGRIGLKQPKQKHRFRVILIGFGQRGESTNAISLDAETVGRPNVNMAEQQVEGYNSRSYYGGKPEWQPIDLVIRDTIDNAVQFLVARQQQKQFDHYNQIGQGAAADYKFEMRVQSMDGTEEGYTDSWVLEGCFVTSFNYGDFDVKSSDPNMITLTVRYDNAILYEDEDGEAIMNGSELGESIMIG